MTRTLDTIEAERIARCWNAAYLSALDAGCSTTEAREFAAGLYS